MTDILLKATALLMIVAAAAYVLRSHSAALRHLVWSLGLSGLVILPLAATTVPWRLRLLPANAVDAPTGTGRGKASASAAAPVTAEAPPDDPGVAPSEPGIVPSVRRRIRVDVPTALLSLWVLGTLVLLVRFVTGSLVVGRIARRSRAASDAWRGLSDRAARALGVRTPVDVRVSDDVAVPFACGVLRPVVVLPADCETWNATRRDAVVLHEMAHVSRGDLAMNMLSHVVRALYWFHPLAWLAAYRLRVESERACDDAVLRGGSLPSDYAEDLLSIVRSVGNTVPAVALAMARRSDFEGRLLAILEPGIPRGRLTRLRGAAVAAVFVAVLLPLAALSPANRLSAAGAPSEEPAPQVEGASPAQSGPVPAAVAALTQTLEDSNASVRLAAVNSLGQLGDPRAIAALAKVLKGDPDARVREAAAWALGEIDDNRAVAPLLDALKSERVASVREKIVRALGEIDDPAAVDGIGALNRDASPAVRRAVAWALGELEDPSGVPALSGMVRDDDIEVRRHVAQSLGELKAVSALDALSQMTRDPDAEVRANAVKALGQFEDQRTLATLVAALRDSHPDVRQHAADAIHNIDGLHTAPPALIAALADDNRDVRRTVAHALGGIGDDAAVPALKKAVSDNDAEVRHNAAEALSEIGGPEALSALMALLKDPDPEVRRIAASALGKKR